MRSEESGEHKRIILIPSLPFGQRNLALVLAGDAGGQTGSLREDLHGRQSIMSNNIKRLARITGGAFAVLAALTSAKPVLGNVIGSDVVNADGTVTYSYIVDNSAGASDIAAWSLEFGFATPDWNQVDTFSGGGVKVPSLDWLAAAGTPVSGLSAQDFLALSPTGDVLSGHSLAGFSFTSQFPPGQVTYTEFSADGGSITGTTVGPMKAAVPEGQGPMEAIAAAAVTAFAMGTRALRRA